MNSLNPELFMLDENFLEKDYDCMRSLSAKPAIQLAGLIEDICDRLEYEGSFLFDETPDQTTILKMTDKIFDASSSKDAPSLKDLIQTMLCSEILYRRCRYYRKKKMFQDIS